MKAFRASVVSVVGASEMLDHEDGLMGGENFEAACNHIALGAFHVNLDQRWHIARWQGLRQSARGHSKGLRRDSRWILLLFEPAHRRDVRDVHVISLTGSIGQSDFVYGNSGVTPTEITCELRERLKRHVMTRWRRPFEEPKNDSHVRPHVHAVRVSTKQKWQHEG